MALAVDGLDILTVPDFATLLAGLEPSDESTGTLQAWYAGEDVDPADLHTCLSIECLPHAVTEQARKLIEHALARLEDLFPQEIVA